MCSERACGTELEQISKAELSETLSRAKELAKAYTETIKNVRNMLLELIKQSDSPSFKHSIENTSLLAVEEMEKKIFEVMRQFFEERLKRKFDGAPGFHQRYGIPQCVDLGVIRVKGEDHYTIITMCKHNNVDFLLRRGLRLKKIYFLSMRLPSRYAAQEKITYKKSMQGAIQEETRVFKPEIAPHLESVRREAYRMIERIFAYAPEFGSWIAVTREALREAERVSKYVKNKLRELGLDENIIARYDVKAIPAYLEPEHAKMLLEAAIAHLYADTKVLKEKIEKAKKAQNRKNLHRLQSILESKQNLLKMLNCYLEKIRSHA